MEATMGGGEEGGVGDWERVGTGKGPSEGTEGEAPGAAGVGAGEARAAAHTSKGEASTGAATAGDAASPKSCACAGGMRVVAEGGTEEGAALALALLPAVAARAHTERCGRPARWRCSEAALLKEVAHGAHQRGDSAAARAGAAAAAGAADASMPEHESRGCAALSAGSSSRAVKQSRRAAHASRNGPARATPQTARKEKGERGKRGMAAEGRSSAAGRTKTNTKGGGGKNRLN